MAAVELIVLLLTLVAALALVAKRVSIPYPTLLVLAGLVLSLIPSLPRARLSPDLVLLFFLPPIVYQAAVTTSWRDFRENLRPILLLGIGLVIFTTTTVAIVAKMCMPGIPWAAAFVLGAIVSPSDTAAAIAVLQKLPVPHRVITILEDESLINDATGLIAYKFAVVATLTGAFSLWDASLRFAWAAGGGAIIGYLVGRVVLLVHGQLFNAPVQATLSLLTPFAAFLIADHAQASGIVAVATAGLTIGWHSTRFINAHARVTALTMWEMIVFILNGVIFMLIGLQMPDILKGLAHISRLELIISSAAICIAVIGARLLWVFPATYLPRFASPNLRKRDPLPPASSVALIAWTGMRGIVSLAAAMALPLVTVHGAPFPHRDLIIFLTFSVILATLVVQGFSLPWIVKALKLKPFSDHTEQEALAWRNATLAALNRLNIIESAGTTSSVVIMRLREDLEAQLKLCEEHNLAATDRGRSHFSQSQSIERDLLHAQREAIIALRNDGTIRHEIASKVFRELDLAEVQLHGSEVAR